jgi:hypothetical protein
MRSLTVFSLPLVLGALLAAPALAQQATDGWDDGMVDAATLDAAVAEHQSAADRQRAELAELFQLPEVRELAEARGIPMEQVESRAAGLSDTQVRGLAPLIASVAPILQSRGGLGTVTISVAAIIIILLVLILVT